MLTCHLYISLLRGLLRALVHILIEFLFSYSCIYEFIIYILDKSLLNVSFANIFSQYATHFLILFVLSFLEQSF